MSDIQVSVDGVVDYWMVGQLIKINSQTEPGLLEVIEAEIRNGIIYVRCHHTPWLAEDEFTVYMGM